MISQLASTFVESYLFFAGYCSLTCHVECANIPSTSATFASLIIVDNRIPNFLSSLVHYGVNAKTEQRKCTKGIFYSRL